MKASSLTIFVALSIAFLVALTYFADLLFNAPRPETVPESDKIVGQPEKPRIKSKDRIEELNRLAFLEEWRKLTESQGVADELIGQSLEGSRILQDLTLGFSSREKMERFRAEAQRNGIRVLGSIPALATVRVRIRDISNALRYMDGDEWSGEISPQYNYPVRQPAPPRMESLEGEKEFADQASDWLGVADDRTDWGKGVKVAVLDSGVDLTHSALKGADVVEISMVEGSSAPGHGTAVASIIAGKSESLKGVAPAASILSIRVLDEEGQGDSFTVAEGIVEAVDRGADIVNLSLGGESSSGLLEQAVRYAQSKGVTIVAAVGNEGKAGVAFPARYEGVIGVTSVDAKGTASSFSNYGEGVDLGAPGVGVYSAWADEGIVSFSGTSTASAFVSGALAAEFSRNPDLPREQAVELLYQFANESEKPGFDEFTGHGVLNVGRIENRYDPYVTDAAIVGYYFDPKDFEEKQVPFLVNVQNQGTRWLKDVELEVEYMGTTKKYLLSNLNPGEVKSEQLLLDAGQGRQGVQINSRLTMKDQDDVNPENNVRTSTITLPSNEDGED
jgi:hypothetical protein